MIRIEQSSVTSTLDPLTIISREALKVACHNNTRQAGKFLPAFVRMFDMDSQTVVFERQPEERFVRYDSEVYEIQLPWMIYVVCLTDLTKTKVFCSTSQLNSLEDFVMVPPIPNVSNFGVFCVAKPEAMAGHLGHIQSYKLLRSRLVYLMNVMWDSEFNNEYPLSIQNLPTLLPANVKADILDIDDDVTAQWHKWLGIWEEGVDLKTAMRWDTNNKIEFGAVIAKQPEMPANDTVAETVIFKFLERLSKSLD